MDRTLESKRAWNAGGKPSLDREGAWPDAVALCSCGQLHGTAGFCAHSGFVWETEESSVWKRIEGDFEKFWLIMEIPPPQYLSFPFIPLIPKQALKDCIDRESSTRAIQIRTYVDWRESWGLLICSLKNNMEFSGPREASTSLPRSWKFCFGYSPVQQ
jgi:hypothetical protein